MTRSSPRAHFHAQRESMRSRSRTRRNRLGSRRERVRGAKSAGRLSSFRHDEHDLRNTRAIRRPARKELTARARLAAPLRLTTRAAARARRSPSSPDAAAVATEVRASDNLLDQRRPRDSPSWNALRRACHSKPKDVGPSPAPRSPRSKNTRYDERSRWTPVEHGQRARAHRQRGCGRCEHYLGVPRNSRAVRHDVPLVCAHYYRNDDVSCASALALVRSDAHLLVVAR
jgi:hypothetical protein